MEQKRKRGGPRGPRPHTWKTGAFDEDRHRMFTPWMVGKAQANFRKEQWNLSFEDYYELWRDQWDNRGRQAHNVCMTRIDSDEAWDASNTIIITRKEHLKLQGERRAGSMNYNMKRGK